MRELNGEKKSRKTGSSEPEMVTCLVSPFNATTVGLSI